MNKYRGCRGKVLHIFYLDTLYTFVARFTFFRLYLWGRSLRFTLCKRLCGIKSWSGLGGEKR